MASEMTWISFFRSTPGVSAHRPWILNYCSLLYHWFRRLAENTQLITPIEEFMVTRNRNPKPFVWTATVNSIVEKLQRCRQTLETSSRDAPCRVHEKGGENNSSRLGDTTLVRTGALDKPLLAAPPRGPAQSVERTFTFRSRQYSSVRRSGFLVVVVLPSTTRSTKSRPQGEVLSSISFAFPISSRRSECVLAWRYSAGTENGASIAAASKSVSLKYWIRRSNGCPLPLRCCTRFKDTRTGRDKRRSTSAIQTLLFPRPADHMRWLLLKSMPTQRLRWRVSPRCSSVRVLKTCPLVTFVS